ncbi:MAG: sulfatase-like hydrolase/transferase, partial [bacterium]
PLVLSAAVLLGGTLVLFRLFQFGDSPADLVRVFILIFFAIALAVGAYFFFREVLERGSATRTWAVTGLLSPLFAALVLLFIWFVVYRLDGAGPRVVGFFALIFAAFLTAVLVVQIRWQAIRPARAIYFVVFALLCIGPVFGLLKPAHNQTVGEARSERHKIDRVIFIVVDTLRPDALSCYSPQGTDTPNMDLLAEDGILFTDAISSGPWTLPGMASLLSGLSPAVHQTVDNNSALPDSVRTLAEYMMRAGYSTAAIGSNIVLTDRRNFSQGFGEYHWFPVPADDASLGKGILRRVFPSRYRPDASTSELTDIAIEWLTENRDRDFFLWLHYFDPHHPYSPPPEFLPRSQPPASMGPVFKSRKKIQSGNLRLSAEEREWVHQLYLGEVRYVDANIGRLVDSLKNLHIYDESLVVLVSDHGEEFWDHGRFEHGHSLYDELLHVPLIVKLPFSSVTTRIETTVPTESVTPTILDLCHVAFDAQHMDSPPLSSLWSGDAEPVSFGSIFASGTLYYEEQEALYFGNLKYVRQLVTDRDELYDRITDPAELNSLALADTAAVNRAKRILRERSSAAEELRAYYGIVGAEAQYDDETIRRLKSLGYL